MTDNIRIPRRLPIEHYLPFVGKTLLAQCDPEPVPLTLVSADGAASYSVTLRSSPEALLVDGIYVLSAPGFGDEPVFLSSFIAPGGGEPGYYYQAIYN